MTEAIPPATPASPLEAALIAAFPAEDIAIRVYFKDAAAAAAAGAALGNRLRHIPGWMRGGVPDDDYLARNFRDPGLRAALAGQGDISPAQAAERRGVRAAA